MTKWQKFIQFKWSPYFWLGRVKKSSGRGVLLGYDMFQAERNIVIFIPIFKFLMYFPPLYPPLELPLGHHLTYGPQMKICWDHSTQPEDKKSAKLFLGPS